MANLSNQRSRPAASRPELTREPYPPQNHSQRGGYVQKPLDPHRAVRIMPQSDHLPVVGCKRCGTAIYATPGAKAGMWFLCFDCQPQGRDRF